MHRTRTVIAIASVALIVPASAHASAVGETADPDGSSCGVGTFLGTASPGGNHAAPFPGILTSWTVLAADVPPVLR